MWGLIVLPFTPNQGARIKTALVLLPIGLVIAWFAGGRQLAVGPVETVGTVGDVVWSKKRDGLVVDPINGKVKLHSPRKHDIVSILDDDNAVSTVTLILSDTNQLLAFRDKHGRSSELRLVTLRHFMRLLYVEITPASSWMQ